MKKTIISLIVVVALAVSAALNFHFILMDSSVKILRKADLTLEYTFVDARGTFNKMKLYTTPALVEAGIKDLFDDRSVTVGQ